MRINFILPVVNMSGGIRVIAIYAKLLISHGHNVVLISPPPKKLVLRRNLKNLLTGKGWRPYDRYPKSHLDGCGFDHRVLDEYRAPTDTDVPDADVIIATWWETAEWVKLLSNDKGAKVYFIQHHEIFCSLEGAEKTYRLPFHQIVIATWLKELMIDVYQQSSVELVPNSVDHSQFFATPRNRQPSATVGFLFHEANFKGVDVTLAAISVLSKMYPDLRIVTFGSSYPSRQLQLDESIEFIHEPDQDKIRDIYARCDVWITSSRSEGFNLTAMEAMACRTPVVSTRTGWPLEAIEPYVNGVLTDVDDVDGIVAAVGWVLALSDAEWRKLSDAAYDTVKSSSWEKSSRLFEIALLKACERAKRGEIAGGGG